MDVQVTSNAAQVKEEKDAAIERAMIYIGMAAETYAKAKCPVGTPESTGIPGYIGGTLRGSITFATSEQHSAGESPASGPDYEMREQPQKGTVHIGTNVEYAPYVENGTHRGKGMAPRPYLAPAISEHQEEYKGIIEAQLKG